MPMLLTNPYFDRDSYLAGGGKLTEVIIPAKEKHFWEARAEMALSTLSAGEQPCAGSLCSATGSAIASATCLKKKRKRHGETAPAPQKKRSGRSRPCNGPLGSMPMGCPLDLSRSPSKQITATLTVRPLSDDKPNEQPR
jgi:hypothetical protein